MDLRAFLLISMSMEEAKAALGFGPSDDPSPQEITKAYREKAFQNHPDRGGSHQKLVEINTAKEILDGKDRPTYDHGVTHDPDMGGPVNRWTAPKPKIITFDEAKSKAGVPHADWQFVTPMQRGEGWSGDESSASDKAFVAYGTTDNKHVFVVAHNKYYQSFFVGGGEHNDEWEMRVIEVPIKAQEGQNPAWLYGHVVDALKSVKTSAHFNSKVMDAKGWTFSEKLPSGSPVSIKHWLVGSGQVAGDAPSVAGRKNTIELMHDPWRSYSGDDKVKPGYYEEPHARWNFWDGKYHGEYHHLALIINGRTHDFSEEETKKFLGLKLGGKRILNAIYGDYPRGGKKQLTRLKIGKLLMNWLAENMTSLPPEAKTALEQSAALLK